MDALLQKVIDRALVETRASYEYSATTVKGDSPIERALFLAVVLYADQRERTIEEVLAPPNKAVGEMMRGESQHRGCLFIEPQFQLEDWRVDFLVHAYSYGDASIKEIGWRKLIVECDGHDFHERTKHQAARDRERDRRFQDLGFTVFRFTGSEIWKDPWLCAEKIFDWAERGI